MLRPLLAAWLVALICACQRAPTVSVAASPEPEAPPAPTATPGGPRFASTAEIRALAERLDQAFEGPLGLGQSSGEAGSTKLRVAGDELFVVEGPGSSCPEPLGIPLLLFEGPEAFLLVGANPPQIVALESGSGRPYCWLVEAPRLADDAEPVAAASVEWYFDDNDKPTRQRASVELWAELPGDEMIEIDAEVPHLRVWASDGTLLLDHGESECEYDLSLSFAAYRLDDEVMLQIDRRCDDCAPCEHGRSKSDSRVELWLPAGDEPIELRGSSSKDEARDLWFSDGSEGVEESYATHEHESWLLGRSQVVHQLIESSTTVTTYSDAESEDFEQIANIREERWTFQPHSGEPIDRELRTEIDHSD